MMQHIHRASESEFRNFQLEMNDELRRETWAEEGT